MGRKRERKNSYNARVIDECEIRGWGWIYCEARNGGGYSVDFGGFADFVGLNTADKQIVAIQGTSGSNHAARVKKLLGELDENLTNKINRLDVELEWLESGGRIVVWSWTSQLEPPFWKFRETEITAFDIGRSINRFRISTGD